MIRSHFLSSSTTKHNIVDVVFIASVLALLAQLTFFVATGRISSWGVAITASIITLLG
jgi:hypothetical protein